MICIVCERNETDGIYCLECLSTEIKELNERHEVEKKAPSPPVKVSKGPR